MTEKYISGLIGDFDGENGELFTEEEFSKLLKEIVAGSILNSLKEEGYLNSYEDETTEELFFLTEKGKKHLEDLNNGIID
jgi:DNA-binding PadR family transcriptional regulator